MVQRLATLPWIRFPVFFHGGEPSPHAAIIAHTSQDPQGCGVDVCQHVASQIADAEARAWGPGGAYRGPEQPPAVPLGWADQSAPLLISAGPSTPRFAFQSAYRF
eukprot:TRINITY_DN13835_c0_g1_i1.p2 TRINITY_DN13835_c0_g1~~TRINITY_DN13835_c0_g1_i1.p2  ORF type:complete len:105 (-),score=6.46 TRINITY_DN13835_c0_g1_i1:562-876(-)